jgi:hypothetical protein
MEAICLLLNIPTPLVMRIKMKIDAVENDKLCSKAAEKKANGTHATRFETGRTVWIKSLEFHIYTNSGSGSAVSSMPR